MEKLAGLYMGTWGTVGGAVGRDGDGIGGENVVTTEGWTGKAWGSEGFWKVGEVGTKENWGEETGCALVWGGILAVNWGKDKGGVELVTGLTGVEVNWGKETGGGTFESNFIFAVPCITLEMSWGGLTVDVTTGIVVGIDKLVVVLIWEASDVVVRTGILCK